MKEKAEEFGRNVKDVAQAIAEEVKDSQAKPHKVIMLGGRRAGKSSLLACIIDQLSSRTPGNICTAVQIDQAHEFYSETGEAYAMPPLSEKKIEIQRFVSRHKFADELFVVDMSPSPCRGSYYVQIRTGASASMSLEFVDVPGEAMEPKNKTLYADLEIQVKESDIYIIAIDTPFLMEADEAVNIIYNRVKEIEGVMMQMVTPDECNKCDRRLVLFSPVKCEKWLDAGQGDLLASKVCRVYRNLINAFVNNPNVSMWIMPVATAGGIEFARFMDAKRVFKSSSDMQGERCSVDDMSGTVFYTDGRTERKKVSFSIENDEEYTKAFSKIVDMPLSWYKSNGKPFGPRFCEQPVYHMLRFLAEKDKSVNEAKMKKESNASWWIKMRKFFFGYVSPFGKYASDFDAMVQKMEKAKLIKESGDGFKKLTATII